MDHTVVTLQTHHTCLYRVSVHQTVPPLSSDSSHLIAAYNQLVTVFVRPQKDDLIGIVFIVTE